LIANLHARSTFHLENERRERTSFPRGQPPSCSKNKPSSTPTHRGRLGAVVNGVCHGVPTPEAEVKIRTGQVPRCYGAMVGGMCTGPMF